ncbi:MAG: ATP-binding cassette domain-containing protein [Mycoplasmoidaceae bacterium]
MSNDKIVQIKNLTLIFGKNTINEIKAIDNFSSDFSQGNIHYIIGDSGSGKSTLVLHLNGLLKSNIGDIIIDDIEILAKKKKIKKVKELRRKISLVFQYPEYQLFKDTIYNDIIFGPKALGTPKIFYNDINLKHIKGMIKENIDTVLLSFSKKFKENVDKETFLKNYKILKWNFKNDHVNLKLRINNFTFKFTHFLKEKSIDEIQREIGKKYLNKMGLDDSFLERNPFGLSGGQKRRVAIAGILSIDPEILVFDEPTAGLDPSGEHETMEIISNLKKQGKTLFVITHSMDQVLLNGDTVTVMEKGKILLTGEPYEVFTNPILYSKTKMEKPKVIEFIDELVKKNTKFKKLYELKPTNDKDLISCIIQVIERKI